MGSAVLIRPIDYAPILPATRQKPWLSVATLAFSDAFSLSLVYWFAVWLSHLHRPDVSLQFHLKAYPLLLLFLAAYVSWGLYPGILLHAADEMKRVAHATTNVCLLCIFITFLTKSSDHHSRLIFLVVWLGGPPAVVMARHLIRNVTSRLPSWQIPSVVLGSGPAAQQVIRDLQKGHHGLRISGVLTEEPQTNWDSSLPPVLGDLSAAPLIVSIGAAQYAVVVMPERPDAEVTDIIQRYCRGFRHVILVPDLPAVCGVGVCSLDLGGGGLGLEIQQHLSFPKYRICKRAIDLLVSATVLILLSPVLLWIALIIKLTSPGPIFFGQERQGLYGKSFRLWKFRTMVPNGNEVLAQHLKGNHEAAREWETDQKLKRDPRVTWVGHFLRVFSLDELPQLLNVLMGQMSLVGPRPIVKIEIERYADTYELYMRVLPGLTGLWQVSGRNNTSYDQRVAFDRFYVRNWSVWLDLYILLRTIRTVLTAEGSC